MRGQLNFHPYNYKVSAKKPYEYEIEFTLNDEDRQKLIDTLEPLLDGDEIWVRLPEVTMEDGNRHEWVLYFKLRVGESRLLLAHPDSTEWVGTCALQHQNAEQMIDKLKKGESFGFVDLFSVRPPSNFHVVFS